MSDKKGSRVNSNIHRGKKRKFYGNAATCEQSTEFTSASAKKIGHFDMEVPVDASFVYCILEFCSVFSTLSSSVICKKCKGSVSFTQSNLRGLGFNIMVQCKCETPMKIPSCPTIRNAYAINRRIVFVMRMLGVGLEGLNMFCGLMDIGKGLSVNCYTPILENIYIAASAVYDTVLSFAVNEEMDLNEKAGNVRNHLTVSGDGTWKKRGFSSLFGVSTLIGKFTGKVLDAAVKSSFCSACNLWKNKKHTDEAGYEAWSENHQEECTANHEGSAGKMEIDAMVDMFKRSEAKSNAKYVTYIGDGDCKTFKGISDAKPYNDISVEKKECVMHVEKRAGTRIRNAKKNNRGVGGRGPGKLTDKEIKQLTIYYGLAIRRHPDSVDDMRNEIWATFFHKCSDDENPQHQNCPQGPTSWCKWQQAAATGTLEEFHHDKPPFTQQVQEVLRPIYEELSRDDLLRRCLGSETQNNNESLNSLIWTFAPKHLHSGPKIVQIATFLATIIFNEGFEGVVKIMDVMGCKIGREANDYIIKRNDKRIARSERRVSDVVRQARVDARIDQAALQDFYEEQEGVLYSAGIAD